MSKQIITNPGDQQQQAAIMEAIQLQAMQLQATERLILLCITLAGNIYAPLAAKLIECGDATPERLDLLAVQSRDAANRLMHVHGPHLNFAPELPTVESLRKKTQK